MPIYQGQFGTDRVIHGYFPHDYKGVCVDVGAYDGIFINNTLFFEQMGWRCLCIEPNPYQFKKLNQSRKEALNYAVGATSENDVDFTIVTIEPNNPHQDACSALTVDQRLLNQHKHLSPKTEVVKVKVRTLDECLMEMRFKPRLDFVSIDTEGTEMDVLRGFSIRDWDPFLMVIENNYPNPEMDDYLSKVGYMHYQRVGVNDFWVKKEEFEHGRV